MHKGIWANNPDALMMASYNGVIRVLKLEELGVPAYTSYRRCNPAGPWRRVLPGVIALNNAVPSRSQQLSAALLYGGDGALISGLEACRQYGLRNVPETETVHLLVPKDRRLHSRDFVLAERTKRMPKPFLEKTFPLAPATRAVLDGARRMDAFEPVRALLVESVQRRFTSTEKLMRELTLGSQRGSALPRKVLEELRVKTASVAEIEANQIASLAGLPSAPQWNGILTTLDGTYIAKPDAWWEDIGLAWEIDSLAFHLDPHNYAKTIDRNTRYAMAGVLVLQTLPARLRTDAAAVVAELKAAYAAAASRPRPNVTFQPSR
jgi:hypothetical protein